MVVKIRFNSGARVRRKRYKNRRVALAMASLLTPGALMACALAFWRLAADLKAAGQFPIADGLFSHWQVWLTLAASLQVCATLLNRYGKPEALLPESVDEPERKLVNSRY